MHTPRPRTLALVAAGLLLLGACSNDPSPASGDPSPTRATDRPDRPGKGQGSPVDDPTSEGGGAGSTTVPVYFVGDTERAGPRLYREFQRVDGDPLEAAAGLLTTGQSLDPDYRSLFPEGAFAGVAYQDGLLVVDLADDGWTTRPPGMSRAEARVAVQSLVYTLQGVQQERAPVEARLGGSPAALFGIDTTGGVEAAPALDVLAHVNLTSPEEGAVVDDGTLEVSGVGNSFEANLGWEVRRGDRVVDDGFATLEGWTEPRLFPFETTVDVSGLEPGDYTFWVTTDDPSGGEGIGAMTDDRTFTVE